MELFPSQYLLIKFLKRVSVLALLLIMLSCSSLDEPQDHNQLETSHVSNNFISIDEAVANAEMYFSGIYGKQTRGSRSIKNIELLNVKSTRSDTEQFGYYVINYNNELGFALVSADRRRNSVYALSNEGSLQLSDTTFNDGLNWYINEFLPSQVISNNTIEIDTTKHLIQGDLVFEYTARPPLLKGFMSKFHQRNPYNRYCLTKNGQQALVGCVPIAVGSFIAFNKWPREIEGFPFNWDEMYKNSNHDGWSRLFEVIGRQKFLNASYGTTVTTASTLSAVSILYKLGYTDVVYNQYSDNIITDELCNGRLVIARGSSVNGEIGHCWIFDGLLTKSTQLYLPSQEAGHPVYKYEKFYHCVWGWGGLNNGYYFYNSKIGGSAYKYDEPTATTTPVYNEIDIVFGSRP